MLHGVKVYGAADPLRWDLHERLTTNEPVVPVRQLAAVVESVVFSNGIYATTGV